MTEVCSCCKTIPSRRSRPRPPKSATAADIVIGTAMKTRKGTSPTLIRGPGGRQSYFKPKRHYLVLAASGASDQDVWGVFGCNFSWRFQWHHRRPWPTSAAGDIADLYPSALAAPHLHGVLVSLTPAINFLPVSLTPLNSLSPVSLTPVIKTLIRDYFREFSKKFKMAPMEYYEAWGTLIHEKTWSRKSPVRLSLNIEAKRTVLANNLSRLKQK